MKVAFKILLLAIALYLLTAFVIWDYDISKLHVMFRLILAIVFVMGSLIIYDSENHLK